MEKGEKILQSIPQLLNEYAPKAIGAIITLIIGFIIIGWINKLVQKMFDKRKLDPTIKPFLGSLISVGLKVMLLLAVAAMFGIQTTSFVAVFGALAFSIGMALQGSLGHFASGVLILIFKPFKVGDLVIIGDGKMGAVERIEVFNTILATLDNKRIIVPNGLVTGNTITNISGQETVGVELTYGISYNDDIDKAKEVILQVGSECPYILDDPKQGVVVAELGNSSVNLATRPFCKSENYWNTMFYMNENVKKAFDKNNISIPFPQMDVHFEKN
ncbi:MAG: mechanosensitive ion channel [Saprospiraceae bacterium]